MARKIPNDSTTFESYINKTDSTTESKQLLANEWKDAFSFKINKSQGYDDISFKSPGYDDINLNVLIKCFSSFCEPLKYLFNLSTETGVFPIDLKISKGIPIWKADNKSKNMPISVLPWFSKILKGIMYNQLYQYLMITAPRKCLILSIEVFFQLSFFKKLTDNNYMLFARLKELCQNFFWKDLVKSVCNFNELSQKNSFI